jgi:hypothetical protein
MGPPDAGGLPRSRSERAWAPCRVDGTMVDYANVRQAERILTLARGGPQFRGLRLGLATLAEPASVANRVRRTYCKTRNTRAENRSVEGYFSPTPDQKGGPTLKSYLMCVNADPA